MTGLVEVLSIASVVGGLYGFALMLRAVFRATLRGFDWLSAHLPFAQRGAES